MHGRDRRNVYTNGLLSPLLLYQFAASVMIALTADYCLCCSMSFITMACGQVGIGCMITGRIRSVCDSTHEGVTTTSGHLKSPLSIHNRMEYPVSLYGRTDVPGSLSSADQTGLPSLPACHYPIGFGGMERSITNPP